MAIILLIKTEDGEVTELPVLNKIIMGRSSASDYKIVDSKMSGSHCSFELNPKGQVVFIDLDSTNGSFINNSRIHQTFVKINDVIRVGNTLIKIDENRLSIHERSAIGLSSHDNKNDKTLPDTSHLNVAPAEAPAAKGKIVLGKNIKAKKVGVWGTAENTLEQEESSGNTRFLQLNDKKKK